MVVSHVTCSPEIQCEPRRRVVHLHEHDSSFRIHDSIILYECSGPHADLQRCAAVEFEEIPYPPGVTSTGQTGSPSKQLILRNHTKCSMKCSCDRKLYKFSCEDTDTYEIACPPNEK